MSLALLAACAPADNWRDLQWPKGQVAAQFPCKPDRVERAEAVLLRCEHRGTTLALAWQPGATPEGARAQLAGIVDRFTQETGVAALRREAALPQGALAWPEAGLYTWKNPKGAIHVLVWARGLTVYQATVMSRADEPSGPGLADPFFAGIRSLP